MTTELAEKTKPASHSQILSALARDGLLRIGVRKELGGSGGDLRDVVYAVAQASRQSLQMAVTFAAQRLLIEVLLRGENIGLMEYRVPGLMSGDISGNCTAAWPQRQEPTPANAKDTGRGWLVSGLTPAVPNLGRDWFLASVPVAFDESSRYALALFRSDEDGLMRTPASFTEGTDAMARASVELRKVYFRDDEIIASDGRAVVSGLASLAAGFKVAIAAGAYLRAAETRGQNAGHALLHTAVGNWVEQVGVAANKGSDTRVAQSVLKEQLQFASGLDDAGNGPALRQTLALIAKL